MNKLIMALALVLTPFFSVADKFTDGTIDLKSPKVEILSEVSCVNDNSVTVGTVSVLGTPGVEERVTACHDILEADIIARNAGSRCPFNTGSWELYNKYVGSMSNEYNCGAPILPRKYYPKVGGSITTEVKTCPPESFPDYLGSYQSSDGLKCYNPEQDEEQEEEEKECGEGYFQYKVYNNAGEGQCVPVSCSAEGSTKSIWAKGSIYGNTDGTYCDGSCASTVSGGQNDSGYSGTLAIKATSTGSACGGGRPDDSWFDSGNGDECQTTIASSGVSFLKCPVGDGGGESPESPDSKIDLGENKLSETDIPSLIPIVEVCGAGDPSCEIRNLKESIKAQETANKELAVETHNKAVEAQQTSTNAIVDSIEGLREANISAAEKASEGGGENGDGATTGGGGTGEEGECSTPDGCTSSVELRQEPSDGLEGFWESEYEDGVEGMFQGKIDELKATEFFLFLDEFKPQISGGSAPMFNWCFNFGRYMNFGCQTVNIDPRVFPALKVFFLLSSAFACRQILFGG